MLDSHKQKQRRPPRFDLIAGSLCLDFINTLDDRFSSQPTESLNHYVDLARFGEDTGALEPSHVDRLIERGALFPDAAQHALHAGVELRETMFNVIWAALKKKPVPAVALLKLNQYAQAAAQHLNLVQVSAAQVSGSQVSAAQVDVKFAWRFDDAPNDFYSPLWPIARSAAELLASGQLQFVRACASETCQWLFLDETKNHRRRWCDMTKCGNRAKVRRFYDRQNRRKKQES